MSHKAPIKIGRLVTVDLLNGDPVRADISLYQRGALKLHGDTPLLVDHDDNRPIGEVHELVEFADSDGSWVWARTTITEPPGWLEKGTKPSVGYKSLFRGGMGEWSWVHRGLVTEVSISHRASSLPSRSHASRSPSAQPHRRRVPIAPLPVRRSSTRLVCRCAATSRPRSRCGDWSRNVI